MTTKTNAKTRSTLNALTMDDLDDLMKMVRSNQIAELEIEGKDLKIRVCGAKADSESPAQPTVVYTQPPATLAPAPADAPPTPETTGAGQNAEAPVKEGEDQAVSENRIEIKSPMVGTFYRAPAPDADSFVEVGDRISEDSVMCIVEAMKLMNEIKAEVSGIVAEIMVENGQPVEFGQTLFLIEPSE